MKTLEDEEIGELLKSFNEDCEEILQKETVTTTVQLRVFIGSIMVIGMLLFNIANAIKSLKN